MKILVYIILILYTGVSDSYYTMIRDPTILHVLFGNVSDMSDLRYTFKNNKIVMPDIKDDDEIEEDPPDFKQLFKTINDLEEHGNHTSDVNELNKITKQLASIKFSFQNASYVKRREREILARSQSGRRVKFDGEDWWWMEDNKKEKTKKLCLAYLMHTRFKVDMAVRQRNFENTSYVKRREREILAWNQSGRRVKFDGEDWWWMEENKKEKTKKLSLAYLMHTRFKVDMAVRQRKHSRGFKAYKIGYMYNRLRHIQYQMAKLINVVQFHHAEIGRPRYDYMVVRSHQLRFLLRVYEKIMRLDVDNRDLIDQMNIVFDQKDPVITYDASSSEGDDDDD